MHCSGHSSSQAPRALWRDLGFLRGGRVGDRPVLLRGPLWVENGGSGLGFKTPRNEKWAQEG